MNGEWVATTEYEATSQNTLAALIGPQVLRIAGTSSASIKPGFTQGGSLLDANASMVEFLAERISLQSRSLAITYWRVARAGDGQGLVG